MAGPSVSETEAKLYTATWAMMKSPFILSVDFARNALVRPTHSGFHNRGSCDLRDDVRHATLQPLGQTLHLQCHESGCFPCNEP